MSTGTRVSLTDAQAVAGQLVDVLRVGCERIEIAGSIRRKAPTVGDIEIVAVPRVHMETVPEGLFENKTIPVDDLQVVIDLLLMDGTLASHPVDPKRGPRYSKLLHVDSGLQVDLFSASAATFGLILMIRTGPEAYSRWLVTEAKSRGHHVGDGALHLGPIVCADRVSPCEVIPTPNEVDVYHALRLFHAAPDQRG